MAHSIIDFYRKTSLLKDYRIVEKKLSIPRSLYPIYLILKYSPVKEKIIIISQDYKSLYMDLNSLLRENVFLIEPYDVSLVNTGMLQDIDVSFNHFKLFSSFYKGIFVVNPDVLKMKIPVIEKNIEPIKIEVGKSLDIYDLSEKLIAMGYTKSEFIYKDGEFSNRGMVFDIFPFDMEPVRIIFDDDRILNIKYMDPNTQRSLDKETDNLIIDAFYDIYDNPIFSDITFENFFNDFEVFTDEFYSENLEKRISVSFSSEPLIENWKLKFYVEDSIEEIKHKMENNANLVLLVKDQGYKSIWHDILRKHSLEANIEVGNISVGFADGKYGIFIINDFELYGKTLPLSERKRKIKRNIYGTRFEESSFSKGDIVVHIDYGVGVYRGIETINDSGKKVEVISIEYKDGILKVPLIYAGKIYKFDSEKSISLDSLSGNRWQIKKNNVKKSVEKIVEELVRLYAKRKIIKGIQFDKDTVQQMEMEAEFPFEETEDQIKSLKEIKEDMEKPYPMDRILCGEVGFGKTEVAMRAAFKAVSSGYQVAVLCPTTILSEQHYRTFSYRFRNFPYIRIEQLSRFVSQKKRKEIIKEINKGNIDIIIGTHSLLSDSIKFNNLGLLIIDEEHRFGVKHKEKIKMIKEHIDTLLITATPIPRTMEMALMKIRDISFINTPPKGRIPVHTELIKFDKERIKEIILREVNRGGQVFFVVDKIKEIDSIYKIIRDILPNNILIGIAHGKMNTYKLEKETLKFFQGKYDILLSTSIMESGIDNPNANTIIVYNAHKFGLSQLHQLRGRVGRSDIKAYAYMVVPSLNILKGDAKDRLSAILRYQDLGSGFNIAVRDLEIRGSGELLGFKQHGTINSIGYSMYWKIVEETARRIKGESQILPSDVNIDVLFNVEIPKDYIKNSSYRVNIYTLLSRAETAMDIEKIREELEDVMGYIPDEMENLFNLAYLRILAAYLGVFRLILKKSSAELFFVYTVDMKCIKRFLINHGNVNISFDVSSNFKIILSSNESLLKVSIEFLKTIMECDKLKKQ